MQVFLSHKMSGLTEDEIRPIRRSAKMYIVNKYGPSTTFVDNYHHSNVPKKAGRLWHLGESIKLLDSCDAVYFIPGHWRKAKGCWVERFICFIYKIKVLK